MSAVKGGVHLHVAVKVHAHVKVNVPGFRDLRSRRLIEGMTLDAQGPVRQDCDEVKRWVG